MTDSELKRIKEIELELLKIFVDTCKKLNLRYYVIGGTLIGAVRHKGFIPWDDDIDVAMPRADYEIWIRDAQKYINEEYVFVQTYKTDPEYYCNFAKLRNSNTTFIECAYSKLNINHGVYIDIFPLDYFPESEEQVKILKQSELKCIKKIAKSYNFESYDNYPKWKAKIKSIRWKLISVFNNKYAWNAVNELDNIRKSLPETSVWANRAGAWGDKESGPLDWFGNGTKGEFEGIEVMLPNGYDKWLTRVYGNYMELPPVEKRIPHHNTTLVDFDKPYKFYTSKK